MGHDIDIGGVATTAITGNFTRMCMDGYTTVIHWHGNKGKVISELIINSICQMTRKGIISYIPNKNNDHWGWGLDSDGNCMKKKDFVSVYRTYLEKFLQLAIRYPHAVWTSDNVYKVMSIAELEYCGFLKQDQVAYLINNGYGNIVNHPKSCNISEDSSAPGESDYIPAPGESDPPHFRY
jgi:hypothetical protein